MRQTPVWIPDSRPGRRRGRTPVLFLAGWLLASGGAAAATLGLAVSSGDFLRLDLSTGAFEAVGQTGLEESVRSLAYGPQRELFGVGDADGVAALLRFDPATGTGTRVADLPALGSTGGLTATGDGALWLTAAANLYRVDPATGAAGTPVALEDTGVATLVSRGSELYGFVGGRHFRRIDPASGALEPIFTFESGTESVVGADFDGDGALRFLTAEIPGLATWVNLAAYRVADLEAGVWEQTFATTLGLTETGAGMGSLAIPVSAPAVEVPTLGGSALAVLALLVAGAGLAALRRRPVRVVHGLIAGRGARGSAAASRGSGRG